MFCADTMTSNGRRGVINAIWAAARPYGSSQQWTRSQSCDSSPERPLYAIR